MFTATAVTTRAGALTIAGELKIASSRVPLEIPVKIEQGTDDTLRLDNRATVSRAAAGVGWNKLGMIRGDATLHAQLTLTRETS